MPGLPRADRTVRPATVASIQVNGEKMTALEGLERGAYGKVYVMLGVNELGWYNDQRYYDNYADLIDLIREVQPEAQIYLQTLIPVTSKKSAGSYINNPQILVYNDIIAQLAEEKQVFLVDVWSAFAEADGALDEAGSVDGVHLTRSYYQRLAGLPQGPHGGRISEQRSARALWNRPF